MSQPRFEERFWELLLEELASGIAEPGVAPRADGRQRLLDALAGDERERLRLAPLAQSMARFFDISLERALGLLDKASGGSAWAPGPIPGMSLFHLRPGARFAAADAGLVRFAPHVEFPPHAHLGEERTLMLEGGFRLDDGRDLRAGEELVMGPGSRHAYRVHESGCLFALVLFAGVEIPGVGTIYTKR